MQEKSESSESSEQAKKINLKELRAEILSMSKQDAMDYILGEAWYKTPRPFQIAILKRSGWNWMESYIATSIENLGRSDNPFYESSESIGELMGVSPRTVRKAGSRLKARGILNREGKNGVRHREWKWMDSDNSDGKSDTRLETNAMISVIDPGTNVTSTQELLSRLPRNYCHVDPGTNVTPHNNRKDLKKKEKNKKEDKDIGVPPFLSGDSSFKKEDKDKAIGLLKDYELHGRYDFCKAFFSLLKTYRNIILTENELDLIIASEILEDKIPRDFRRQAILADWMTWYVLTPPRPKEPPYLSNFKKSWDDYLPVATALWESITAPERQQREAEAKARQERQDREDEEERRLLDDEIRQSLEKKKAAAEAKRQKEIQEEEARKNMAIEEEEKRKREIEKFQKSLPSLESIRLAVNVVPTPENWLDNFGGYHKFMEAMLRSISVLRLTCGTDSKMYHYPYLARDSFGSDHGAYEQKSRDFVVAEAGHIIDELKSHGVSAAPISPISWRRFAQFFGIDHKAEFVRPKLPVTTNGDEDFESPFSDD